MKTIAKPKITALAPWFGSNRMLAASVGEELTGCSWIGVPFAGGMSELLYIRASGIVVGDLHRHVINLARVVADPQLGPQLYRRLRREAFHPDRLREAQHLCRNAWDVMEETEGNRLDWAIHYFICCWMGRSAMAGTDKEFGGKLPVRWSASGGDSNTRFRSAVESLRDWRTILARCNFVVQDVFEFLASVKDQTGHGLYLDPPFPGPGDDYRHKFPAEKHRKLAECLGAFHNVRIVCRFYDHPLVAELYPENQGWSWRRLEGGRKQSNEGAPEVLIINGPSYVKESALVG